MVNAVATVSIEWRIAPYILDGRFRCVASLHAALLLQQPNQYTTCMKCSVALL